MEPLETTTRPAVTWTDFVSRRWKRIDLPKSNLGKIALEEFVQKHSIPHLKVIKVFSRAADVSFKGLPEYFVFKPAALWSGTGVRLLHRIAGMNLFFDAKNNLVISEEEVRQSACRVEEKFGKGELEFIVEERAIDEDVDKAIPLDYKVFTFHGVTKFVLQVDRNFNPPKMAFFDGNFEPISDDRVQFNEEKPETKGNHRRPECWEGILEVSRRTTLELDADFISVDCYATKDGPMLGELTHTPGGPWYGTMYRFSNEFDVELGNAWREANERLGLPEAVVKVPFRIMIKDSVKRTVY